MFAPRATLLALVCSVLLAGCASEPAPLAAPAPDARAPLIEMDRSIRGLFPSAASEVARLSNGSRFELDARLVTHDPGTGRPVRMMAYNGMLPGPTLRVEQGSEITVGFTNRLDVPTSVHWHGLRLDAASDGVPGLTQDPIAPGGRFEYALRFPDDGLYWYHPHVREDAQQDLGLYGAILVDAPDAGPAGRERLLLLDDVLLNGDDVALQYESVANHVLMGRYGNAFLTNMRPTWEDSGAPGERVRLLLVNVANARPLELAFEGAAAAELVALDGGQLAQPTSVQRVVLAPSERATVDVTLPAEGEVRVVNARPEAPHTFATLRIDPARSPEDPSERPTTPHERARASIEAALVERDAPVSATWTLDVRIGADVANPHGGHPSAARGEPSPIEWESADPFSGQGVTTQQARWSIRDKTTGQEGGLLAAFERGDLVRIRIENPAQGEHPMQHPIHLHGQRFLVLGVDDEPNDRLAWKDTVLVPSGSTVEILVEMSNPGEWMVHCHINEHLEAGMHASFAVR